MLLLLESVTFRLKLVSSTEIDTARAKRWRSWSFPNWKMNPIKAAHRYICTTFYRLLNWQLGRIKAEVWRVRMWLTHSRQLLANILIVCLSYSPRFFFPSFSKIYFSVCIYRIVTNEQQIKMRYNSFWHILFFASLKGLCAAVQPCKIVGVQWVSGDNRSNLV